MPRIAGRQAQASTGGRLLIATRVPAPVAERMRAVAERRGVSVAVVLAELVERGLADAPEEATAKAS